MVWLHGSEWCAFANRLLLRNLVLNWRTVWHTRRHICQGEKRSVFLLFFFCCHFATFFPFLRLLIWILNIHSFGIFINFARCTNWKIKESTTLQRRRVIQPKLFPPLMRPRGRGHITTTAMLTNGIKDKIALLCRGVGHCCCCKQLQSA